MVPPYRPEEGRERGLMRRCLGEWEILRGWTLGLGIMAIEWEGVRGGDEVGEEDEDRRWWLGAGNSMWGRARTVSWEDAIGSSSSLSSTTLSSGLASNGSTRIGDGGLDGGGTSTLRNRRASVSVTGPLPLPAISILLPTTTQQ
jgi:hypothetical protein